MGKRHVRITHAPTDTLLAEGPLGWGITPFEGNFYIQKQHLKSDAFRPSWIPGICIYKFFYVWMDLVLEGKRIRGLGWKYFLPNPLFPFIWFRIALPGGHPELRVEKYETDPSE